jgi:hypothetical protein
MLQIWVIAGLVISPASRPLIKILLGFISRVGHVERVKNEFQKMLPF